MYIRILHLSSKSSSCPRFSQLQNISKSNHLYTTSTHFAPNLKNEGHSYPRLSGRPGRRRSYSRCLCWKRRMLRPTRRRPLRARPSLRHKARPSRYQRLPPEASWWPLRAWPWRRLWILHTIDVTSSDVFNLKENESWVLAWGKYCYEMITTGGGNVICKIKLSNCLNSHTCTTL